MTLTKVLLFPSESPLTEILSVRGPVYGRGPVTCQYSCLTFEETTILCMPLSSRDALANVDSSADFCFNVLRLSTNRQVRFDPGYKRFVFPQSSAYTPTQSRRLNDEISIDIRSFHSSSIEPIWNK